MLAEIAALRAELDELRRQVKGKTPQNSSLPPSTQHPHAKPAREEAEVEEADGAVSRATRNTSGRSSRRDECDEVQDLKPTECRRCGERSSAAAIPSRCGIRSGNCPRSSRTSPSTSGIGSACPCCGETTCAELPPGVPPGQSGPRLVALTALLMAYFRQSKRRTAVFLAALLGQPCCPALTVKMQNQATAALRPAYDELVAQLPTQDQVSVDETPTKEQNRKAWLWTFVARTFTVFAVRATREATALVELLTAEFAGVVTCDRAKMYWRSRPFAVVLGPSETGLSSADRQRRRPGQTAGLRSCVAAPTSCSCTGPTIATARSPARPSSVVMAPIRREVERLLLRGAFSGNRSIAGMCRELYDHRDWLWTFVRVEGVEPTNNASERALRHAVIWRKLSFGTQSADGSRFVETMLTVIETCRQQNKSAFELRHPSRPEPASLAKKRRHSSRGVNGYRSNHSHVDSKCQGYNCEKAK